MELGVGQISKELAKSLIAIIGNFLNGEYDDWHI